MTTTLRGWRRRFLVVGAAATLALTAGLVAGSELTSAAWTDPEHARGTLTATTVNPPTITACTGGTALLAYPGVTLSWAAPTGGLAPTRYRYVLNGTSTTLAATTTSVSLARPGGNGPYTVSLYAEWVGASTTWSSTVVTATVQWGWTFLFGTSSCTVP